MTNPKQKKSTVFYEKFYTDDTGKHIPDLFGSNTFDSLCVKAYWGHTVDAFYRYESGFLFSAMNGDFRIVTAEENGNGYKFTQYFLSGLDGKVLKLPKDIWFGINNLQSTEGSIVMARIGRNLNFDVLKSSIFDWHSKH